MNQVLNMWDLHWAPQILYWSWELLNPKRFACMALLYINSAARVLIAEVAQTPAPLAGVANNPLECAGNSYFRFRVF